MSSAEAGPLEIIIVGAGIAGLAAAISCRRAGHNVNIYERSGLNNEIGAAIHVCPNASRGLLTWGLDPVRARFVTAKSSYRANGTTLEKFHVSDDRAVSEKYGAPWFYAHRVDLHTELKRLATGADGVGKPATVHLRKEVTEFNADSGSIKFKDGTTITGDIIIAADGVHTRAAHVVLGRDVPVAHTNHFAYRLLIPSKDIAADPVTAPFLEGADGQMKFFVGEGKRIVWYPCRNNEEQNFVGIFHDETRVQHEDWNTPVDQSALLERYSDFHPHLLEVFKKAKEVKQWPLLFRTPIPSWHKGKLVLIGDAAHPMLPHQGQGGAQSIEDAIALGIVLSNLPNQSSQTLTRRLELFEKIRINRASVMQIFSNAGQDNAAAIQKDAAKFLPADIVPKNPEDFFKYNFGYDVVKDSEKILLEESPGWTLPDSFVEKLAKVQITHQEVPPV